MATNVSRFELHIAVDFLFASLPSRAPFIMASNLHSAFLREG